jgi:hypothetical protein
MNIPGKLDSCFVNIRFVPRLRATKIDAEFSMGLAPFANRIDRFAPADPNLDPSIHPKSKPVFYIFTHNSPNQDEGRYSFDYALLITMHNIFHF